MAGRLYVGCVVAAAAILIYTGDYGNVAWPVAAMLGALFVACESTSTSIADDATVSLSFSAALASVVLVGPTGAALVSLAALFSVRKGLPVVKRAFNAAQFSVSAYAAGTVFETLHGKHGVPQASEFPGLIGPYLIAAFVYIAVNMLLVGGVLLFIGQLRFRSPKYLHRGPAVSLVANYAAYATFGLLIAALWTIIGWVSVFLVLTPLVVARWAFAQYTEQQRAHEATLAAMCQAVETKDYYTRGHCVRVSRGSAMIAEELGMHADRVDAVRHAGMMHDVGKLGVPTRVLQKSGPLTPDEFATIQLHPMRGLEIVREIGFLDEALAGILHHHERIDGRGYPMGLAGDEIPEFARIIGVADALDSMTSTRSYRGARPVPEALEELLKCAGAQFDPVMVDALIRSIKREGWDPPRPVGPPDSPGQVARQDHDDPTAPLRVSGDPAG
ncbi:MAG TPA: HD-GYP domain-containing protein [Streptosporangiaceae bacterium]